MLLPVLVNILSYIWGFRTVSEDTAQISVEDSFLLSQNRFIFELFLLDVIFFYVIFSRRSKTSFMHRLILTTKNVALQSWNSVILIDLLLLKNLLEKHGNKKKNAWCIFICNKNNFVKIIILMDVKKNLIFDCSIISELKRKKKK